MRTLSSTKTVLSFLILFASAPYLFSQKNIIDGRIKSNWLFKNPFEQKVFIENKGQFDNQIVKQRHREI